MARLYENPMAPPGYESETECVVEFYKPMDARMKQLTIDDNFVSLLYLLTQSDGETASEEETDSEEETGAIEEEKQETKQPEMQQNTITLVKTETLDSLNAFIAEYKNKHKLPDKEVKSKRRSRKKSKDSKLSEKLNRSSKKKVHKNKSSRKSTLQDPLNSSRSSSNSTSSSTERSSRLRSSTTFDKSSIQIQSPNRRSVSPQPSTSRYKSRPSKHSTSPCHRISSGQHHSSSRKSSIHSPSRPLSPTGSSSPQRQTSPSRRSVSPQQSTTRYKSRPSKCSTSPRYRLSSRKQYSRSPSPSRSFKLRTSPNHRSRSHHYSRSRITPIHTPSRSPSFERPSRYKHLDYKTSSRLCSSRKNKSPSYQRSPSPRGSHVHSPEKSSSRYKSYDRSSLRQRSLSPRSRSPRPPVPSNKSSNQPKSSVEESKCCKSPIRQRKFPIEDDYTRILAEEMIKRQIWDGSDLEEEGEVSKQNAVSEKSLPVDHNKGLSQNEQNSEDEVKIINNNELQSNSKLQKSKFLKQEIKSEPLDDQKASMLGLFYCQDCQLSLNSEVTWQSHITGKKHAKVIKLQTVHGVAKNSIPVPVTPVFASEDAPRFSQPFAGKIRRPIADTPRLKPVIDDADNCCIIGLDSVWEIRSERETHYYCEICDAPCSAHSIMPHLIGYKHQLRYLREIDPQCYERNKLRPKKEFDYELSGILFQYERQHGRGQIKVFEERDDTGERSQPGPSWRNGPSIKTERNIEEKSGIPANDECLDTSKSDFYCKLCDAHMNNINMWESHVRGKRHLRNAKKIPGENISKHRSVKAPPHVASKLDKLISENAADEIIVGLDSIRETQGPNGENYTCFPCGSNCTSFDIIDHLCLTKHRIRYLEKLVVDGKPNGISTICQMEIHDEYFRKRLIDDECLKMMEKYGSGTAEVYLTKN